MLKLFRMQIVTLHNKQYKIVNDNDKLPIAYPVNTSDAVINHLEHCRKNNIRIIFDYGNTETGESWHEKYDITGYIGLSRGHEARYPILLSNKRSLGGGIILTNCIIGIKTSKGKKDIYKFSK